MADPKNTPIDIESMSDEDFMKLDPSQMQENASAEEKEIVDENTDPDGEKDLDDPDAGSGEVDPDDASSGSDSDTSDGEDPDKNESDEGEEDSSTDKPDAGDADKPPVKDSEKSKKPDAPKGETDKSAKPDDSEEPEKKADKAAVGDVKTSPKDAMDFYDKVTASFKADGRDVQVKTPEDAIRLMQMGVNYSRRMQEMKPLRAQDQMLKSNGLNDPEKLNFLIDLSKGNKEAIKQLLKDYKIDPVDIDTSTEDSPYQANNYQGDPKDLAFDDAIKETISQDGGRELISDINRDWDTVSKEALRDQPTIFQNILAQKRSGVYSKIQDELKYQRTMGYLTDVPFLQAYHQVGEAMQKAGVFNSEPEVQPKAKALGTGTRKAAPKPKTEQPTPNVSSATPPRSAPSNDGGHPEPDYSSMSDEEFKKLAPPG